MPSTCTPQNAICQIYLYHLGHLDDKNQNFSFHQTNLSFLPIMIQEKIAMFPHLKTVHFKDNLTKSLYTVQDIDPLAPQIYIKNITNYSTSNSILTSITGPKQFYLQVFDFSSHCPTFSM